MTQYAETTRPHRPWLQRFALLLVLQMSVATLVLGAAPPGRAQEVPDPDLRSYVLFGFDELAFKGGQGNHGPSLIRGGNIGVNGTGPPQGAGNYRLNICANAQMVMSAGTMVVGDTARIGDTRTSDPECDIYKAFVNTPAPNNEEPRTGPARRFNPPPVASAPDFPAFDCDPSAPDVTVPKNGTGSMTPGSYDEVEWQNGTTISLAPGTYTICRITTGQHVTVNTQPGVVLQVARDFLMNDDMSFDGNDCAGIPLVYVKGDGVSANNNAVKFGQDSRIWGHFYVPTDRLNLGNQTDLHGTFWAREIGSDFNVDVQYCAPPVPPPPTGSISVTKTLSGNTAGAPGRKALYGIRFDCAVPARGLRNALDRVLFIRAGRTRSFDNVQIGTRCRVREVVQPRPDKGFVFDSATVTPRRFVLTGTGPRIDVLVDNPLREVFGTIKVRKRVTGADAGYVEGSLFRFRLDCDDDEFDTRFRLADRETFTSEPIRVGTRCRVKETGLPGPADGFSYAGPAFDPSPPRVRVRRENQVVRVVVSNELVRGPSPAPAPTTGPEPEPTTGPTTGPAPTTGPGAGAPGQHPAEGGPLPAEAAGTAASVPTAVASGLPTTGGPDDRLLVGAITLLLVGTAVSVGSSRARRGPRGSRAA